MSKTKKYGLSVFALTILSVVAISVFAGSVYDRDVQNLSTSAGTAKWTNEVKYGALLLKKITFYSSADAGATLTVSRVTADGVYTQAVCSIAGASADSAATSLTTSYLLFGDALVFSSSASTGGVVMIEYEKQEH